MILNVTSDAKRVLNKDSTFSNSVYRALKDIEILLDTSYFKGNVILEDNGGKVWMNIIPNQYLSSESVRDMCDQISYLIQCNNELDLPFTYNSEIFRYRGI
tara:strand:- start:728 stop:1030 length:303 start_codon:yes stop_codon:yes gene_type:complete